MVAVHLDRWDELDVLERDARRWVAVGLCIAALAHMLAAAWLIGVAPSGSDPARINPLTDASTPADPLKLGLAESRAVSINWLGMLDPSPVHEAAIEAEQEQAAQRRALPGAAVGPSPDQPSASRSDPAPSDGAGERRPVPDRRASVKAASAVPALPPAPEPRLPVAPQERPTPAVTGQPQRAAASGARAASASGEAPGDAGGAEETADTNARPADRDSVAAALESAANLTDWTKPLASGGLEIVTRRPNYSITTQLIRVPQNPVIRITFGADGRVRLADWVRDRRKRLVYDTGSAEINEPLLSAVYRWRAKGAAIDALDPDDPKSTIDVVVRVVYR